MILWRKQVLVVKYNQLWSWNLRLTYQIIETTVYYRQLYFLLYAFDRRDDNDHLVISERMIDDLRIVFI